MSLTFMYTCRLIPLIGSSNLGCAKSTLPTVNVCGVSLSYVACEG